MHRAQCGLQNSSEQAALYADDYLAMSSSLKTVCMRIRQLFKTTPVKFVFTLLTAAWTKAEAH